MQRAAAMSAWADIALGAATLAAATLRAKCSPRCSTKAVNGTTSRLTRNAAEMRRRARLPMSDTANYQAVLELLDPVNLIDYMIANMYAGNIDWQDNNGYAIRNGNLDAGGDGK